MEKHIATTSRSRHQGWYFSTWDSWEKDIRFLGSGTLNKIVRWWWNEFLLLLPPALAIVLPAQRALCENFDGNCSFEKRFAYQRSFLPRFRLSQSWRAYLEPFGFIKLWWHSSQNCGENNRETTAVKREVSFCQVSGGNFKTTPLWLFAGETNEWYMLEKGLNGF